MHIDQKDLDKMLKNLSKEDRAEYDAVMKDPERQLAVLTEVLKTVREWKKYTAMHDKVRDALRN